jgi:hypothetical protein
MFWEDEKEEKRNEKFDKAVSGFVDDLSNRTLLFRYLLLGVSLNAALWLVVLVFYETVNQGFIRLFNLNNKIAVLVLGFPLMFGFLITYTLCRLKFPDIEDNNLQSEIMASYAYQAHSLKRWYIWLFSSLGGVLNVVLLFLVNLYLNA